MFGWSRAVIVWKFSVMCSCPFPGPLARESGLLLGVFFFFGLCSSAFLSPWLLQQQVWEMWGNKNPGNSTVAFLGCWDPCLVCLLSIFWSYLVLVLYIMPGVLEVVSRRNGDKYVYFIFLEMGVLHVGRRKKPPPQVIVIKSNQGAQLENLSIRVLEQPRVVSVERPKGPGVFPKWRSLWIIVYCLVSSYHLSSLSFYRFIEIFFAI